MTSQTVREVMTRDVVSVRPDTPFREIVALLDRHRISAVPVVDRAGVVVGVVSEADLLPKLRLGAVRHDVRWLGRGHNRTARAKAGGTVARDLMSTRVVTALPNTWVVAAARRMDAAGVRRLVVVDDLGRLQGILSRHDLLTLYRRPDAEILEELRRALYREHPAVTARLSVGVEGGVVTVTGEVPHVSQVSRVAYVAGQVPGVVDVRTKLVNRLDEGEDR
jgi:CBS-domain-containing membrane protein